MGLLKTKRNELLELIVSSGQSLTDFQWIEGYRTSCAYVGRGSEGQGFAFVFDRDWHSCRWRPGIDAIEDKAAKLHSWTDCSSRFTLWLQNVKREIEAPDLWGELEQLRTFVTAYTDAAAEIDDVPLIEEERVHLVEAINQVRALVEGKAEVDAAERAAMRASLDRFERSSRRISRKDIVLIVLGSFAIPLITRAVSRENAHWLLIELMRALAAVRILASSVVKTLGP